MPLRFGEAFFVKLDLLEKTKSGFFIEYSAEMIEM